MKNLVLIIIALIIIVGIISFIGFNIGKKGYFDISLMEDKQEKNQQVKKDDKYLPSPDVSSKNQETSLKTNDTTPAQKPKTINSSQLTSTGASKPITTGVSTPTPKTKYIATQETKITINGKTKTYSQAIEFNSNQCFKQTQKIIIK